MLTSGTRIGACEIVGLLGAGGMGEVYRARDTRLKREVALKVLPESFASDPERLARFAREAEVLAALNHPNIAAIYGVEEARPDERGAQAGHCVQALVMELVEGETLADRIARGPIALDEALPIARQIAEALEAAHEQGIIHRDLKPANIKVRPDGTVKVLDFGLAKLVQPARAAAPDALSLSPTITSPALVTGAGILLGSAAYMSPEQARGRVADRRSDIWAFGCVLFEMLAGRRPFDGEEVTDVIVTILSREPQWMLLPDNTPRAIRRLLRRCLVKQHKHRLADAGAARLEIEDAESGSTEPGELSSGIQKTAPGRWRVALASLIAAAALALLAGVLGRSSVASQPVAMPARFVIALPEGETFSTSGRSNIAISPDGTQIAYSANGRLFRRLQGEFEGREIPGAASPLPRGIIDDTSSPAFSPTGDAIVFYSPDRSLKRIAPEGGVAVTVCPVDPPFGVIWDESGMIFGQGAKGIYRCSPNGGSPEQLVKVAEGEEAYGPQIIGPDRLMFTVSSARDGLDRWDKAQIVVQSLSSGERRVILPGGSDARYLPSGHLLYAVGGTIMAVRFDPSTLTVSGTPAPVVQGVRRPLNATTGVAQYAVSDTGTLVYIPGPARGRTRERAVATAAAGGTIKRLPLSIGPYVLVRATRDGRQLALESDDGKQSTLLVAPADGSGALQRVTFIGNNRYPVWSPDGKRLAFQSDREGDAGIFVQNVDGTGTAQRLTRAERDAQHAPEAWSPDGRTLLFAIRSGTTWSLSMLAIATGQVTQLPEVMAEDSIGAVFSPDGKWFAYRADAGLDASTRASTTGITSAGTAFDRPDRGVFVQPFPPTGARYQAPKVISDFHPVWTPDGNALVYIPSGASGQMAIVRVTKGTGLSFGVPTIVPALVTGNTTSGPPRAWDVLPDGAFIGPIIPDDRGGPTSPQLRVVLNWTEELKRLVPIR